MELRTKDVNGPGVLPAGAVRRVLHWIERLPAFSRYIGSETVAGSTDALTVKRGAKRPPPFEP